MKKLNYFILSIFLSVNSYAGKITHTDYTAGSVITSAGQNANENTIFTEFNGNIDNTNIKTGGVTGTNIANNTITNSNIALTTIDATRLTTTVQQQLLPSGVILPYVSSTAPSGFLECDGSAQSRTTFAALFAVIGSAYGNGDGATTFNLPDLRGYFPRGYNHGSGHDPDSASRTTSASGGNTGDNVGSFQASTTSVSGINLVDPGHQHSYQGVGGGVFGGQVGISTDGGSVTASTELSTLVTTGITLRGGNESRPPNVNVMYIIKT